MNKYGYDMNDQFWTDYRSFLGSTITPSGKVRETPMSSKDAYRAAVDMYRKRSKEVQVDDLESYEDMADCSANDHASPLNLCIFNDLVNKVFQILEEKSKDQELCRYFAALIYRINAAGYLDDRNESKYEHYIETVDVELITNNCRNAIGAALGYKIDSGSQCRKLDSVHHRLTHRLYRLGISADNMFNW